MQTNKQRHRFHAGKGESGQYRKKKVSAVTHKRGLNAYALASPFAHTIFKPRRAHYFDPTNVQNQYIHLDPFLRSADHF